MVGRPSAAVSGTASSDSGRLFCTNEAGNRTVASPSPAPKPARWPTQSTDGCSEITTLSPILVRTFCALIRASPLSHITTIEPRRPAIAPDAPTLTTLGFSDALARLASKPQAK